MNSQADEAKDAAFDEMEMPMAYRDDPGDDLNEDHG